MPDEEAQLVWFPATPTISQPILTFPLIGFISLYQAIIIFGIGLPTFFVTLQVTQTMHYAAIPFLAFAAFAMVRPPVLSYEGRILAIIMFYAAGGKEKKKPKSKKTKSRALKIPSSLLAKPGKKQLIPDEPLMAEKMNISVGEGSVIKIALTLRTREGMILPGKRVKTLVDGNVIRRDISSPTGEVIIYLENTDCIGTRKIAVQDIEDGKKIVEKEVVFTRVGGVPA